MKDNNSDDLFDWIYSKILLFISYKERTEFEVIRKLRILFGRQYIIDSRKAEIQNKILDNLYNLKLLDDRKYSKMYIKEKIEGEKPVSKPKIISFLIKKGVPRNIIEDYIELYDFDVEFEFVKKEISRGRATKYLLQKGYSLDVIKGVVDTLEDVK